MSSSACSDSAWPHAEMPVLGRYRIEGSLGRGGVADVYRAFDERAGRHVALKCLRKHGDSGMGARLLSLFRHEYMVLSQIAHPSVVRVHDFGLEDGTHYYTMELLAGELLSQTGPLSVTEVVQLLTSLCEPLSVLHARGWVHLDLSPRNVIRTYAGEIKLIDFGATSSMDESLALIGTPSYMAPEALYRRTLDARTDIFGLGALAYFALTGRRAFPARKLAHLPAAWRHAPVCPSELASDVPPSLAALVLEMLSLDPSGRPRSAAAVQHRLGAARRSLPPTGEAARAFLDTPALVGRDHELGRVRGLVHACTAGRGSACVIVGAPGSGRTRMLDSLVLEACLAGQTTVQGRGKHGQEQPLSLVYRLIDALMYSRVDITVPVWPERLDADTFRTSIEVERLVAQTQRVFVDWLEALAVERPVVLTVDDIELADLASQNLLAQLAMLSDRHRIVVAVTLGLQPPPASSPLRVFTDQGTVLRLRPLREPEVEQWVRSVFGEVHNVARLARWLHKVGEGMPLSCMALAAHLVDTGVARLTGGNWQLPDSFDGLGLPRSVREALHERLARLGKPARAMLQLLAAEVEPLPLPLADYLEAFSHEGGDALRALSELCAVGVLSPGALGYSLAKPAALEWAREGLSEGQRARLHKQLGRFYLDASADGELSFALFAAHHLVCAGEAEQADAVLPDLSGLSRTADVPYSAAARFCQSDAGITLFETVLALRKRRRESPWRFYLLRRTLLQMASVARPDLVRYADEMLSAILRDTGLDRWDEVCPQEDDQIRLALCLSQAKERHERATEAERGLSPEQALRELARTAAFLNGASAVRYEPRRLFELYRVLDRVRSLSPALDLVASMTQASAHSLGLGADVGDLQRYIVETTSRPIPGIDDATRERVHCLYSYYLAQHLAAEGNDDALRYVPVLEREPVFEALALQVRRVHALLTGRYRDAQRYRRERELLALQSETSNHHLEMSLLRESHSAHYCGDVLETSRCRSALRKRAERYPGFRPWAAILDARMLAGGGDFHEAKVVLEAALSELDPSSHGAYQFITIYLAEVLVELGEYERARELARGVLAWGQALGIRLQGELRARVTVALADAGIARLAEAATQLDALVRQTAASPGTGSLLHGHVCEARCQVALAMGDRAIFAQNFERLALLYTEHPGLRARLEGLRRLERARFHEPSAVRDHDDGPTSSSESTDWATRLSTVVAAHSHEEQARYLLAFILEQAEADAGQLYSVGADLRPVLLACRPRAPDAAVLAHAQRLCLSWDGEESQATQSQVDKPLPDDSGVGYYRSLWLFSQDDRVRPCGLVLIRSARARCAFSDSLKRALAEQMQLFR